MAGIPKNDFNLTLRQQIFFVVAAFFFAVLPTKVFIEISSDTIQISVIAIACIVAFMTVILSIDTTFGLEIPPQAQDKVSERHTKFSQQLVVLLRYSVALFVFTIVAKSLALWLVDSCTWPFVIVRHFVAWIVGGMVGLLIIRIDDIPSIFGYLSVGADIGRYVRAMRNTGQTTPRV